MPCCKDRRLFILRDYVNVFLTGHSKWNLILKGPHSIFIQILTRSCCIRRHVSFAIFHEYYGNPANLYATELSERHIISRGGVCQFESATQIILFFISKWNNDFLHIIVPKYLESLSAFTFSWIYWTTVYMILRFIRKYDTQYVCVCWLGGGIFILL